MPFKLFNPGCECCEGSSGSGSGSSGQSGSLESSGVVSSGESLSGSGSSGLDSSGQSSGVTEQSSGVSGSSGISSGSSGASSGLSSGSVGSSSGPNLSGSSGSSGSVGSSGSSGSSGSGSSGSGLPKIQTACCANTISQNLILTIPGVGSFPMNWTGSNWRTGVINIGCGTIDTILRCNGSVFEFLSGGGGTCTDLYSSTFAVMCSPLQVSANMTLTVCPCPPGYTITVTE